MHRLNSKYINAGLIILQALFSQSIYTNDTLWLNKDETQYPLRNNFIFQESVDFSVDGESSFPDSIDYINGIIYHGYNPNSQLIRFYDIIVNSLLGIYINIITPNQPYIFITSFFTTMVFLFNSRYIRSRILHVVCIQWVLLQLYNDS